MQLVFLTPRQALSSYPSIFNMILWESMNFHPDPDRTADPWVTSPMLTFYTMGGTPFFDRFMK